MANCLHFPLPQFHICKMERAANHSFLWENILTIRSWFAVFLRTAASSCISLHMHYVYRTERDIHLPMGSLSFFRREIRRERERERLSVVVPEWAVVHSDVSCSDWLLVSLAALWDLNIFRQKSLRPRLAPWFCSSLEQKVCKAWTVFQWSLNAQGNETSFLQPPPNISITWGCFILNSKYAVLSATEAWQHTQYCSKHKTTIFSTLRHLSTMAEHCAPLYHRKLICSVHQLVHMDEITQTGQMLKRDLSLSGAKAVRPPSWQWTSLTLRARCKEIIKESLTERHFTLQL